MFSCSGILRWYQVDTIKDQVCCPAVILQQFGLVNELTSPQWNGILPEVSPMSGNAERQNFLSSKACVIGAPMQCTFAIMF